MQMHRFHRSTKTDEVGANISLPTPQNLPCHPVGHEWQVPRPKKISCFAKFKVEINSFYSWMDEFSLTFLFFAISSSIILTITEVSISSCIPTI